MTEGAQPTAGELLKAILALHAFTETGLRRLDSRIDRLDAKVDGLDAKIEGLDEKFDGMIGTLDNKIERLRYDMNKRFDHVYDELGDIKMRVTRLELRPT